MIYIYRATRGGYKKLIPFLESGMKLMDENGENLPSQGKHACDHPKHWQWGKGTRNGQKLYFPLSEMFCQKWHLTKKQMKEAISQYDMASLEMPTRIICADCATKELNQKQDAIQ